MGMTGWCFLWLASVLHRLSGKGTAAYSWIIPFWVSKGLSGQQGWGRWLKGSLAATVCFLHGLNRSDILSLEEQPGRKTQIVVLIFMILLRGCIKV